MKTSEVGLLVLGAVAGSLVGWFARGSHIPHPEIRVVRDSVEKVITRIEQARPIIVKDHAAADSAKAQRDSISRVLDSLLLTMTDTTPALRSCLIIRAACSLESSRLRKANVTLDSLVLESESTLRLTSAKLDSVSRVTYGCSRGPLRRMLDGSRVGIAAGLLTGVALSVLTPLSSVEVIAASAVSGMTAGAFAGAMVHCGVKSP